MNLPGRAPDMDAKRASGDHPDLFDDIPHAHILSPQRDLDGRRRAMLDEGAIEPAQDAGGRVGARREGQVDLGDFVSVDVACVGDGVGDSRNRVVEGGRSAWRVLSG